jgi:hypothetical protein
MAMWNNQMVNPNLHRAEFVWKFIGFSTKNRWLIMISWHGESSIYGHLISNVSTELWSSSMLMGFSIIIHPAVVPPFMEVLNPYNDHFFLVVNYCGWLWNPSPADMWFIPLYIQYWINVVYRLPLIQGATTNYLQYIVDKYFFLIWILPPQFLIDMNIPQWFGNHPQYQYPSLVTPPREAQDWQQRRTARQEEQLALQARGWHPMKDRRIWLVWYGYGSIPINTIFNGMNIHLPAILGFTRYQGFDPSPYDQWLPSGKLTVGPWQIEVGRWVSIETVLLIQGRC